MSPLIAKWSDYNCEYPLVLLFESCLVRIYLFPDERFLKRFLLPDTPIVLRIFGNVEIYVDTEWKRTMSLPGTIMTYCVRICLVFTNDMNRCWQWPTRSNSSFRFDQSRSISGCNLSRAMGADHGWIKASSALRQPRETSKPPWQVWVSSSPAIPMTSFDRIHHVLYQYICELYVLGT